jgi:hypothetical protein
MEEGLVVQPQGGITVTIIYGPDFRVLARGDAQCSRRDNYNKKIGRNISFGRALKEFNASAD